MTTLTADVPPQLADAVRQAANDDAVTVAEYVRRLLWGRLMDTCYVDGCGEGRYQGLYCASHYLRWYRYGDPLAGGTSRRASEAALRRNAERRARTAERDNAIHDALLYGTATQEELAGRHGLTERSVRDIRSRIAAQRRREAGNGQ